MSFQKILIANRGEIAERILKTLKKMAIQSVVIYAEADRQSPYVELADEAYSVGDGPLHDSYLNIKKIIKIAKMTAAYAIHPGYGFLSENPLFRKACDTAGIVFIGPSFSALEIMASKKTAKQRLEAQSIPLIPGYHGEAQDDDTLFNAAKNIGFPLIIKPASGGGGKGMSKVSSEKTFLSALHEAKRLGHATFSDETVILEKYLKHPKHIEVQILADSKGNIVHLFERDCSLQRRHQKIIEEAPAFGISKSLQNELRKTAIKIAREINYQNAGTVEFLVENDKYYFIEMNTRLQVEHPVTEMITAIDLVEWQIRIAAKETLPHDFKTLTMKGHAIECRIYAEDPMAHFLPQAGTITTFKKPCGPGIRVDSGIEKGSVITTQYDPMLAKLIAFGNTREMAQQRLAKALLDCHIIGVSTNLPFLTAIIKHPRFIEGTMDTHFLSNENYSTSAPPTLTTLLLIAAYDYIQTFFKTNDPIFRDAFAFQPWLFRTWQVSYRLDGKIVSLEITARTANHLHMTYNDTTYVCDVHLKEGKKLLLFHAGKKYEATIIEDHETIFVATREGQVTLTRFSHQATLEETKPSLQAPMHGTVTHLLKSPGNFIQKGDALMVLEAMKMEHTIRAPEDGMLEKFLFRIGEQVKQGQPLLILSPSK